MNWQLWLPRNHLQQARLSWQKKLTHPIPERVANGFATILARMNTPAQVPNLEENQRAYRTFQKAAPSIPDGQKELLKTQNSTEHRSIISQLEKSRSLHTVGRIPPDNTLIYQIPVVENLELVRTAAMETGGYLKPATGAWKIRGALVLDERDPKGYVVQFKQSTFGTHAAM